MNHLIYTTFGEQRGSVYATQVIQLLNYWSKRENWKVTLIQIADVFCFDELESEVDRIYIKRDFKLLLAVHKNRYVKLIKKQLLINNNDDLYFNSRGGSAYSIASCFIKSYDFKYKCNNLDIRGTIEELKISKTRWFFYPFFKLRLNLTLKNASSITTVTSNLRDQILENKNLINNNIKIKVVPTLSILQYKPSKSKKNIAYIGQIAWITPKDFVAQILKLNKLFLKNNWIISIIGNSSGTFGLEKHDIVFVERMSPQELNEKINDYHTGLVLRNSSIINRVAAPCKISDYLCLGMPIIYSGEIGSIKDFKNLFPECSKYIKHIDELNIQDDIDKHIEIDHEDMMALSEKAKSYFGVNSVIDSYISFFKI
jgi:hypothetical protein